MTGEQDDRLLDETIRRAVGAPDVRFDAAGWLKKHREEVAILESRKSQTKGLAPKSKWKSTMTIMKYTGGLTVAATVAIVAILTLHSTTSTLSAAEALKQVTTATSSYEGWIHGWFHMDQTARQPARVGTFDLNTKDDTTATVTNIDGVREVMYLSPAKKEYLRYDSKTKTIFRNVNNVEGAKAIADVAKKQLLSPETLQQALDKFVKSEVIQGKEGDLDKFEITPKGKFSFTKLTVLADPKTKLIRQMDVQLPEGVNLLMKFTYSETSQINSIYDLDVPRDAKIVEAPPASRPAVTTREGKGAIKRQIPAVAKLDMRLGPYDAKEGNTGFSPKEINEYLDLLKEGKVGEWWATQPGQKPRDYIWLPVTADESTLGLMMQAKRDGKDYLLLSNKSAENMLASDTGTQAWGIKNAYVDQDLYGRFAVTVVLDQRGAERLAKMTKTHVGYPLAFIVNGETFFYVSRINAAFGDMATIAGNFTAEDAKALAAALKAGMSTTAPIGGPLGDLGAVLEQLRGKSYEFQMVARTPEGEAHSLKGMVLEPGKLRIEQGVGLDTVVCILDSQEKQSLLLFERQKAVYRMDKLQKQEAGFLGFLALPGRSIDDLWKLKAGSETKLGKKDIEGKPADGFQVKQKYEDYSQTITVWADAKTAFPVMVEIAMISNKDDKNVLNLTLRDFKVIVKPNTALFSTDVPEGYTLAQHQTLQQLTSAPATATSTAPSTTIEARKVLAAIGLWKGGEKSKAVEALAAVDWKGDIRFGPEHYLFAMTEKQYISLVTADQQKVFGEVIEQLGFCRAMTRELIDLGKKARTAKDADKAEKYFAAAEGLGQLLDCNPDQKYIVRTVGIAVQNLALKELSGLYEERGQSEKLKAVREKLSQVEEEQSKIKKAASEK